MYNSGAGLFALVLHLILYRKAFGKDAVQAGSKTASRFRAFLIASEGFFLFDAAFSFRVDLFPTRFLFYLHAAYHAYMGTLYSCISG